MKQPKRKNTAKPANKVTNIRDLFRAKTGAPKCRNPFPVGTFVKGEVRVRKDKSGRPVIDIRTSKGVVKNGGRYRYDIASWTGSSWVHQESVRADSPKEAKDIVRAEMSKWGFGAKRKLKATRRP